MTGEIIWKVGFDEASAKKAGKVANKEQSKGSSGKSGGGGAFAGGFIGSILGNLLSSVKALFDPLSAVASLLVTALFPLFKPFLILFLKVGIMLYKWIQGMLGTSSPVGGLVGKGADGSSIIGEEGKKMGLNVGIIAGVLTVGAAIFGAVGTALGLAIPAFLATLGGLPVLLIGGLAVLVAILSKYFFEFGLFLGDKLADFIIWLGDKLADFIIWAGDVLSDAIIWLGDLWSDFIKMLGVALTKLAEFGQWLWDSLVGIFDGALRVLSSVGSWIWTTLTNLIDKGFSVLKDFGKWVKDAAKAALKGIGSWLGFGGGNKKTNDGIVTPSGELIRTNPSDYIIATKNPGALMGGGSGGGNVNVTINGGLITEDVAREIGRVIQRQLSLGGGY